MLSLSVVLPVVLLHSFLQKLTHWTAISVIHHVSNHHSISKQNPSRRGSNLIWYRVIACTSTQDHSVQPMVGLAVEAMDDQLLVGIFNANTSDSGYLMVLFTETTTRSAYVLRYLTSAS